MKKKEERTEKKMAELMAENKRLTEPLQKAREEVEELRRQLANYEKDKETLRVCSALLFFSQIFCLLFDCFFCHCGHVTQRPYEQEKKICLVLVIILWTMEPLF